MIIINNHIINLFTVIALFSIVLFSKSSLVQRSMDYEEDNLINTFYSQNRNVFAVEMDLEDDGKGNEGDEDEDKSFDYVFDPSYYIGEDTDSEKKSDANTNNNIEN